MKITKRRSWDRLRVYRNRFVLPFQAFTQMIELEDMFSEKHTYVIH